MKYLATTAVSALRAANIPSRVRDHFMSADTMVLRWASSCADLAADTDVASLSDIDLRTEFLDLTTAPDILTNGPALSRALAIVAVAIQRRLGAWKVFEFKGLPEQITMCIDIADSICESPHLNLQVDGNSNETFVDTAEYWFDLESLLYCQNLSSHQIEITRGLIYARAHGRFVEPADVSLPPKFYDALLSLDNEGTLHFEPTREQTVTAALLVRGLIVEMDAGEGKTISAAMAAAIIAATGRSVHVLTANDYLALRDSEWLSPVYKSLGISVGAILSSMEDDERRPTYSQQVIYTTAREAGFDFLRDNLSLPPKPPVQGRLDTAIVDEADHVLIDQDQTPLIISGTEVGDLSGFHRVHKTIRRLVQLQATEVDEVADAVSNTRDNANSNTQLATLYATDPDNPVLREVGSRIGIGRQRLKATLEEMVDSNLSYEYEQRFYFVHDSKTGSVRFTERGEAFVADSLYDESMFSMAHQFLQAHTLFKRDRDYVVHEDHVVLVDQLNGRLLPDNRYMYGIQAALEAKEGLPPRPELETLAQITVAGLMRLYKRVSGLTGTALEARDDFIQRYGLRTVRVPPTQTSRRKDQEPLVFATTSEQRQAVVKGVRHWHSLGRPVLVGTSSIEQSREISALLSKAEIEHTLLNAVNTEDEARIVRDAGRFGAVTVATNMVGRGTDIVLGPGLDQQILAACRRQVEDLIDQHVATAIELQCDGHEEAALVSKVLSDIAGVTISVAEGHTSQEATVLVETSVTGIKTRQLTFEFGLGLCVIGTSLNPTSRVDRQLQGRAGRQGDFGGSRILVSAQDSPIAFSRQAASLSEYSKPNLTIGNLRASSRLAQLVRDAQSDGEADARLASALTRDYWAVLEAQTLEYYNARKRVFGSREWHDECNEFAGRWVDNIVTHTFHQRSETDYVSAFEELAAQLWTHFAIDCGALFGAGMAVISVELGIIAAQRLEEARSTIGATRFDDESKLVLITVSDSLWPDHLSYLRDVALCNAIAGYTHRSAVAHFTRNSKAAYRRFVSSAWAEAIPSILTLHYHDRHLSQFETTTAVQEEILSLLG